MAVQIRALKFSYEKNRTVLDIPELTIERRSRSFVYGPSGCGKSTLLGILAGVHRASSGDVEVLGKPLSRFTSSQRDSFRSQHIGYIFQLFNLIPYLNVLENIVLPCWIEPQRRSRLGNLSAHSAAEKLASHLGIAKLLHQNVAKLSVGQQQRVAVARALIGSPELIIADEPTSALDADHRKTFLKLLFEQIENTDTTLIFVSHDLQLKDLFPKQISLTELNRVGRSSA